jgi:hypothetical protein
MQSNIAVAKAMINKAHGAKPHPIEVPPISTRNPVWGKGKQTLAWRISGRFLKHADAHKTQELCDLLFPLTKAQKLRRGIVAGYQSIMGAKEGGSVQKAIAKFLGISDREPWCAETAWYVLKKLAGFNGNGPMNKAYVPSWELWAKQLGIVVARRNWLPGMYVTFVWNGVKKVGTGNHIGVLVKTGVLRHVVRFNPITAEGNAGGPGGDAVREEVRYFWQINMVFDPARLQK